MAGSQALSLGNVLSKVVSRSKLLSRSNERTSLYGVLETPVSGQAVSDSFEVRGWVISEDGEPPAGELIIGDRRVPIAINESRVDVARAYGLDAKDSVVGFRHFIHWNELPEGIDHLDVSLSFSTSEETLLFGPLGVEKALSVPRQRFAVALERPGTNEVVAGNIEIRGWLLSLTNQAVSGRALINDEHSIELVLKEERPDVLCAYDCLGHDSRVGFREFVSWNLLGEDVQQAKVSIELTHGGELLLFGPYTITRASAPVLRHQRGSYKEVWDGAAHDEVSAMACVAGTSDYEDFFRSGVSTAETLSRALEISHDDVVLEIGCGVGRVGMFLSPRCRKWIGCDISRRMLAYAAENLGFLDNVELRELSSCRLDGIADNSVDKLYCSTVFMHLDEWDRFSYVSEACRVLRQGGRCYFDNVNLAGTGGWQVFSGIAEIDSAQRSPAVSKTSTGEELETYLKMGGFRVLEIRREALYVSVIGQKL